MKEFLFMIQEEFIKEEIIYDKRKKSRKHICNDEKFDELMKKLLSYENYCKFINYEDDINRYWSDREIRLIRFVIKFFKSLPKELIEA